MATDLLSATSLAAPAKCHSQLVSEFRKSSPAKLLIFLVADMLGRAAGPATTRLQELAATEAGAGATKHSVLLDRDMVARLVAADLPGWQHV
jgi:hypothetical protein